MKKAILYNKKDKRQKGIRYPMQDDQGQKYAWGWGKTEATKNE